MVTSTMDVSGVRTIETHWIPPADGRRLAARLFLPAGAESSPSLWFSKTSRTAAPI